jgi:hypothetical protein
MLKKIKKLGITYYKILNKKRVNKINTRINKINTKLNKIN